MAQLTLRSRRKASGGRYKSTKGKKLSQLARYPAFTKLGKKTKTVVIRTRGGNQKLRALTVQYANATDKNGKTQKTEIMTVTDNPANPNLVRRNVITKGATIETKLGKAIVTSRPGQSGLVQVKLLEN